MRSGIQVGVLGLAVALLRAQSGAPAFGGPILSKDDIVRMHAAAARLYEGRAIGSVERWRSPSSKDSGYVTLTRRFEARRMPCRTIEYTIRFHEGEIAPRRCTYNWCQVSAGVWKIFELD